MYCAQGATIKTDEETGKIVIARVMHGGAADRSGLIHAGDEVIEVNGISVENKTPADVLAILVNIDRDLVEQKKTFDILPLLVLLILGTFTYFRFLAKFRRHHNI